ncbi:YhdP family protein [Pusillimonas minor]|uniref:TIGR02099 family protein n=1 Tax=Pusillimonas minor TaxID=2697024 RepID=A0A842HJE5_9BURK|nr:TIGR02099 family protein [Pusillimonas minor]
MRQIYPYIRWLGRTALVLYFVLAALVLGVRYWVLPNIDTWRPYLEQQLSGALGSPVTLGKVSASWSGLNPSLQVEQLAVNNAQGRQVFSLPQVSAQLHWLGLLSGQVRLLGLEATGLVLDIRRATDGRIWLMGQPLEAEDTHAPDTPHPFAQWLLAQQYIALDHATLRWRDEMRDGRPLALDDVTLQFLKVGQGYQASLTLNAPAALAESLSLSANIQYEDQTLEITDPGAWSGRLYTRMTQLQPQAWAPWIDIPQHLKHGEVSGQWWIDVRPGQSPVITADVHINEGRWQLDDLESHYIQAGNVQLYAGGPWSAIKAIFESLGVEQSRPTPAREGDEVQWRLRADELNLSMPEVFEAPLSFEHVALDGAFRLDAAQRFVVPVRQAHVVSEAMDLVLQGRWQQGDTGTAGMADFKGRFNRASLNRIGAHLPKSVDPDAREWLGYGLMSGQLLSADIVLAGALDHFPFGEAPDQGRFQIAGRFEDTDIDYAPADTDEPGWPRLMGVNGVVMLDRVDLRLYAESAQVSPAENAVIALADVRARIPNIESDAVLTVQGASVAPASAYLALAHHSPLGGLLDNALDLAQADGQWQVPLKLRVPLLNTDDTTVQGQIFFDGGQVVLDPDVPALQQVSGHLNFSDTGLDTDNLKATFLGGPLAVRGGIGGGRKGLALEGRLTADALTAFFDLEGMKRLSGVIDYTGTVRRLPTRRYAMAVQSALQGLSADFPAPVGKGAQQQRTLRAEWVPLERGSARLDVSLANDVRLRLLRRVSPDAQAYFDAVAIGVGQTPLLPTRGLSVDARYPVIDADIWMAIVDEFDRSLSGREPAKSTGARKLPLLPSLRQLRAQAGQLKVYGLDLDKATLTAAYQPMAQWRVDVSATETAGTLFWKEANGTQLEAVDGKFERLALGRAGQADDASGADQAKDDTGLEHFDIPELKLDVRNFTLYGKPLGQLLVAGVNTPEANQWVLNRLAIKNESGELDGTGVWKLSGPDRGLSLDAEVKVVDLGGLLDRLGMADAVSGGNGTVTGKIRWGNMPWRFSRQDISGQLRIDLQKGRFSSVNSRSAKVLELLSFQSMQRLLTFDLNPNGMFREGFPFDSFGGTLAIERGVMTTNNYRVEGPVGNISLGGDVNLVDETLNLQAMVVPNLDMSGAALAGIAINPIVGVGAFLTQWLLKAPLSRAMTLHYQVTGKWDEPRLQEVTDKRSAGNGNTEKAAGE